jgi:hypothetical protein
MMLRKKAASAKTILNVRTALKQFLEMSSCIVVNEYSVLLFLG